MRHCPDLWIFSAVMTLALCLTVPAEAATSKKKKPAVGATAQATTYPTKSRRVTSVAQPGFQYRGGVPAGPLYNGQDYLGNDPDPNIRSQILRDLGGRYGGND